MFFSFSQFGVNRTICNNNLSYMHVYIYIYILYKLSGPDPKQSFREKNKSSIILNYTPAASKQHVGKKRAWLMLRGNAISMKWWIHVAPKYITHVNHRTEEVFLERFKDKYDIHHHSYAAFFWCVLHIKPLSTSLEVF